MTHSPALIDDILKHIPHRYPFVLIDRMEACEPGRWVRVSKTISATEWFFCGVPFEQRVMPSLLLVEALAQSSGVLSHYSGLMKHVSEPIIFFAGIDDCRFGCDVRPGHKLLLECTLIRTLRDVIKVAGYASVDGQMAVD